MREMKDSGIEWIGEIPKDWEIKRAKTIFVQRCTKGNKQKVLLAASQKFGMIPQIEVEGVVRVKEDTDFEQFRTVHKQDFVISLRSFQGGFEFSQYEGVCSPAYQVFYNKYPICHNYYRLLFKSDGFIKKMNSMTIGIRDGKNIQYVDFANSLIPVPPILQQEKIADYLDKKCSKIDEIISKQQTVIEKLKEYKLSIITEAVTKGLNPDVTMKDSGVEWIGEIPEHWEVVKLKYLIDYIESGVSVNAGLEKATVGEIGVLKTSSVSKFEFDVNENKSVNRNEENRVACPIVENTIIVSRMNTPELVGACGYVNKSYNNIYLPDRLWQVHFYNDINVKYIWYYLRCKTVRNYYASLATGTSSSMQNISQGQFSNVHVSLPIKDQQKQIADYLDSKCEKIDFTINKKQKLIDKLTEYKKSLIYEVVTGKKEV